METKLDITKPILSPTRSLDEGFESDPDRISTDSELTTQSPTFDLLQRTDRDGVQHTQIRRNQENGSGCDIDSSEARNNKENSKNGKLLIPRAGPKTLTKQEPSKVAEKPRRIKTKAPLPPDSSIINSKNNHIYQTIQPRSQSVDRSRVGTHSGNQNQNVLAGKFVRITVDPQQNYLNYLKNCKTYQPQSNRILPIATTGSTSNLYKIYHHSSNSNSSLSPATAPVGLINLSNNNSNLASNNLIPLQYGLTLQSNKTYQHHHQQLHQFNNHQSAVCCWTQSIPRQTRK